MGALRLQGIGKRYGEVRALDGLDVTVEDGRFFALLGPSAAGKTTTLRLVAGLERPDTGRIWFDGRDLTEQPVQARAMAMVFQTFALYPHLTVRQNLAYPLREARTAAADIARRVDDIAEMLRIRHTLDRRPSTLSGGEAQRVAIGRALIKQPRLLLLDEPLTNLDAKLRHDTRAEFKRLHRELGMTMLYATPDQLEALSMADTIGVLRAGSLVQVGTPLQLYERPVDGFVAQLVGAPRMNLVPAWLKDAATVEAPFMAVSGGPWAGALAGFGAGTALWLGFRPNDLQPAESGADGPRFRAQVHLTEPLGDVTILDLVARDTVVKMVLPEEQALRYRPGDELEVCVNLAHTHLFARETGVAIR